MTSSRKNPEDSAQEQVSDNLAGATWVEVTVLGVSEEGDYVLVQAQDKDQFVVRRRVLGDLWHELNEGKRLWVLITEGPLGKVIGAKPGPGRNRGQGQIV